MSQQRRRTLVPDANDNSREKARRIASILERLNVTVLTAEHDYLEHNRISSDRIRHAECSWHTLLG